MQSGDLLIAVGCFARRGRRLLCQNGCGVAYVGDVPWPRCVRGAHARHSNLSEGEDSARLRRERNTNSKHKRSMTRHTIHRNPLAKLQHILPHKCHCGSGPTQRAIQSALLKCGSFHAWLLVFRASNPPGGDANCGGS